MEEQITLWMVLRLLGRHVGGNIDWFSVSHCRSNKFHIDYIFVNVKNETIKTTGRKGEFVFLISEWPRVAQRELII